MGSGASGGVVNGTPTVVLRESGKLDGTSSRGMGPLASVGVVNRALNEAHGAPIAVVGGTLGLAPGRGNWNPVPVNIKLGEPN